jgi:elongation factor Ts
MMSQVKELRTSSGAPIVDCKKALDETGGDIEKSLDWLRKNGTAKASKKLGDREAEEGLVSCAVSKDGKSASIVQVSSETDFAGKSDAFVGLACHVAGATLSSSSSGDLDTESSVLGLEFESKSVQTVMEEAIVAIRENLGVKKAVKLTTGDDGLLVAYVHGKADGSSDAGLAAAVVEISGEGMERKTELANQIGKKLAMHIVAAKPAYLNSECIPEDVIEKEKNILKSQVRYTH